MYSQICLSTLDIGMEFFVTNEKLYLTATTKLPWLKVSPESYKLDGSDSLHNRRDMRKGETWHALHQVNSCAFAHLLCSNAADILLTADCFTWGTQAS